jgi:hypothetical protein
MQTSSSSQTHLICFQAQTVSALQIKKLEFLAALMDMSTKNYVKIPPEMGFLVFEQADIFSKQGYYAP